MKASKIIYIIFFITIIKITITMLSADLKANDAIILQSTTSAKNSGFYDLILPKFKAETGIAISVVAVGTGAAIRNTKNCDGDMLIIHSPSLEKELVSSGYSKLRHDFMFNDFIIIGPISDPANINDLKDPILAFEKIFKSGSFFLSRSDNSGTHVKEMFLWEKLGVDPQEYSGKWYLETGTGMGSTINTAIALGAYTLTDRATWLNFGNKGDFSILLEGNDFLHNPYAIIVVNNKKCPKTKVKESIIFANWLISKKVQKLISSYKIEGKQLFFPYLQ